MFHLALLSVGFSQQDSCVHLAMLSGYRHIDIHHRGPRAEEWEPSGGLNRGYVFSKIIVICQEKFIVFVATNFDEKRPLCLIFHGIAGFSPWKIRFSANNARVYVRERGPQSPAGAAWPMDVGDRRAR